MVIHKRVCNRQSIEPFNVHQGWDLSSSAQNISEDAKCHPILLKEFMNGEERLTIGRDSNDQYYVEGVYSLHEGKYHDVSILRTNGFLFSKRVNYIIGSLRKLDLLFNIPETLYDCIAAYATWDIPRTIQFRVTNPGEQMTNTFNKIVITDNNHWYDGKFYDRQAITPKTS